MFARQLQLPPPRITFAPPKQWLPRLRALLDAYPQDDLLTTEALCCRVVGDFSSGIVLHRLLYWLPLGTRRDGAIWKSDREWYAELNLSYAQMQRVRLRLKPIVDIWIEKAQGAPTFHYALRIEALVQAIATVLGRSTIDIKLVLMEKVENGFSKKSKMDSRKSRESITDQHQIDIDERLKIFEPYQNRFVGFNPQIAAKLIEQVERLGEGTTRDILARCDRSRGRAWAYVLQALENAVASSKAPIPLFDTSTPELVITDEMTQAWQDSDAGREWQRRIDEAHSAKHAQQQPTSEHEMAWNVAYSQLELQFDRASFETWLRGAVYLGFSDDTFQIGVRNTYARDMLQGRAYRDIRRILCDLTSKPVEVRFEVHQLAQRETPFLLMQQARDAEIAFYRSYTNG